MITDSIKHYTLLSVTVQPRALFSLLSPSSSNPQAEIGHCSACRLNRWTTDTGTTGLLRVYRLECFLRLLQRIWMNSLTPWHLTPAFGRTSVCQLNPSAHRITTSHFFSFPQTNSGNTAQSRSRPTEAGASTHLTKPETHWQRKLKEQKQTSIKKLEDLFFWISCHFPTR